MRRQRDDRVHHKRKQGLLSAAGLVAGTGAAVLSIFAAPVTPIVLVSPG